MSNNVLHNILDQRIQAMRDGGVPQEAGLPGLAPGPELYEQEEPLVPMDLDGAMKLASAVEHIAANVGGINDDRSGKLRLVNAMLTKQAEKGQTGSFQILPEAAYQGSQPTPGGQAARHVLPMKTGLRDGNAIPDDEIRGIIGNHNIKPKKQPAALLKSMGVGGLTGGKGKKKLAQAVRRKMAGSGGSMSTFISGEGSPATPSGYGNQARSFLQSNSAAINMTKRQAKAPVKKQLAEILSEPALSSNRDDVLKRALKHSGVEKISHALQRATSGQVGDGRARFVQAFQTKVAQAPPGGAPMGPPPGGAAPPGPGMVPQGGPPQQTGDPVVLAKLKAALMQKKAETASIAAAITEVEQGGQPGMAPAEQGMTAAPPAPMGPPPGGQMGMPPAGPPQPGQ